MSNGAANPYLVQTDGMLDTIKKAVVGKDKHELLLQVEKLKRQRDELKEAEQQAVTNMRALANTLQAQIDQTTNPR
jgi:hypothetical protein